MKAEVRMRKYAYSKRLWSWAAHVEGEHNYSWSCVHDHGTRDDAMLCALRARALLMRETDGEASPPASA